MSFYSYQILNEFIGSSNLNWEHDSWLYHEMSQFDIGISLMIDHPFNQAKSAFKAKQYLVCGVPVLANDIGEIPHFVFDQRNGFICNSDKEIVETLDTIQQMDEEEYRKLRERCLEGVATFSVEQYCKRLLESIVLGKF